MLIKERNYKDTVASFWDADNADVPTQICTDNLRKSALNLFISVICVPFFVCGRIFIIPLKNLRIEYFESEIHSTCLVRDRQVKKIDRHKPINHLLFCNRPKTSPVHYQLKGVSIMPTWHLMDLSLHQSQFQHI